MLVAEAKCAPGFEAVGGYICRKKGCEPGYTDLAATCHRSTGRLNSGALHAIKVRSRSNSMPTDIRIRLSEIPAMTLARTEATTKAFFSGLVKAWCDGLEGPMGDL